MNGFAREVARSFDALLAEARCPPPARNHRRGTQGGDDVVATLVAQALLHRISPHDVGMAASER